MREGMIAITFDDGFATDLTVALQSQLDRGMTPKGTSYIITNKVDGVGRLSTDNVLSLVNNGWDVQCHSHTHPLDGPQGGMTGLTAAQLHQEMQNVNAYFTSIGLPAPDHHAFPGGDYNKLIRDVVGRYRKTMRTTTGSYATFLTQLPPWRVRPVSAFNFDTASAATLNNIKWAIRTCKKYGLGAILFSHEFTSPEQIAQYGAILDYCLEQKIRLVTISEMYNEFH